MNIEFGDMGRVVGRFEKKDGSEVVLVDITDALLEHTKYEVTLGLLRDLGFEEAYRSALSEGARLSSGPDFNNSPVLEPAAFKGVAFGDYSTRFDVEGMTDSERDEAIDKAVKEFSAELGDLSMLGADEDEVDLRSMMELFDSIRESIESLSSKALSYRVTHGLAQFPVTDEDIEDVGDVYGAYIMGMFGAIAMSNLCDCNRDLRDLAIKFDASLKSIPANDIDDVRSLETVEPPYFLPDQFFAQGTPRILDNR